MTPSPDENRRRRWEPGAVVLAFIPVLLYGLSPSWMYSSLFHDPWIYYGHYLDPARMIARFDGLYYGTRLSIILPGYVAHRLLPPVAAHLALHLMLVWTSLASLFYLTRTAVGPRPSFLACLTTVTNFYFLGALGCDYTDAFGITYLLAASALTVSAGRSGRGPLRMAAAGALSTALVAVNLVYVIVLPAPWLVYFAVRARGRRRAFAGDAVGFLLGAAALFGAFGLYYWSVTGKFWFLRGSINFVKSHGHLTAFDSSPFKRTDPSWFLWASWLALPCWVLIWAVPRAISLAARRPVRWPDLAGWYVLQFVGVSVAYLAIEVVIGLSVLQPWYYATMLIPFAALALAALIARFADALSPAGFRATAVTATVLLVGSVALPWPFDPAAGWPLPAVALAVAPGVAAVTAFAVLPRCGATGILSVALIAASQFAARVTFDEGKSVPDYDRYSPSFAYRTPARHGRLPSYATRVHQYDPHRKEVLLAVDEVVRFVRDHDARNRVAYWFDFGEPLGVLFDNILCTRDYGWSLLNFNFPALYGTNLNDGPPLAAGQTIAVLSARQGALKQARLALLGVGFDAHLLGRREVSQGPIRFTVLVFELRRP